jgi:hypothetical protein
MPIGRYEGGEIEHEDILLAGREYFVPFCVSRLLSNKQIGVMALRRTECKKMNLVEVTKGVRQVALEHKH